MAWFYIKWVEGLGTCNGQGPIELGALGGNTESLERHWVGVSEPKDGQEVAAGRVEKAQAAFGFLLVLGQAGRQQEALALRSRLGSEAEWGCPGRRAGPSVPGSASA